MASGIGFRAGIGDFMEAVARTRAVLICAGEDPARCHRTLLIGPAVGEHTVRILHIRQNGALEGVEALG